MYKIKRNKTSKQVTKDPKEQERDNKLRETYIKKLKEEILRDTQLSTSPFRDNSTPSTFFSKGNSISSTSYSAGLYIQYKLRSEYL